MKLFRILWKRLTSPAFSPTEKANLISQNGSPRDRRIKVLKPGDHIVTTCTPSSFEAHFGMRYLTHLTFTSEDLLLLTFRQRPWVFRLGFLGMENAALYEYYRSKIHAAYLADMTVAWIDETLGYGLYANEGLEEGAFIGTYTGIVRPLSRTRPDHNVYCMHYPTRFWSRFLLVVDAGKGGNEMRFANHSDDPNMSLECLYDRGLLFFFFRAARPIGKGSPLTFDYGDAFWRYRMEKKQHNT